MPQFVGKQRNTFPRRILSIILACMMSWSSLMYSFARGFAGRPAASWSPLHCTSNWFRCSQLRNDVRDGCETPKVWLMELCQPSALFVVLGPVWSQCDHRAGGNEPISFCYSLIQIITLQWSAVYSSIKRFQTRDKTPLWCHCIIFIGMVFVR